MKRFLPLLFIFTVCLDIYAQDTGETKIFVPPISGTGSAEDNSYFYKQLVYEVTANFCSVVRSKRSSDYSLIGRIETLECHHDPEVFCPFHSMIEQEIPIKGSAGFIFYLELINTTTSEAVIWQYIIYDHVDRSIDSMVSAVIFNMLSSIPDISLEEDPRDRWLFAGIGALWAPRIYRNDSESVYLMNFGLGLEAEFQFLDFMAVSAGLQFTQDWILVSNNREYRDLILEIPVALRIPLKPGKYLLLEPYGGVSFNFSLMKNTEPSLFSWFAGFQFGVKAGPGFITIDPRFTMDFLNSRLSPSLNIPLEYHRYIIQIAAGYKFGLFRKKLT